MGHAIGRELLTAGYRVVTTLEGRSAHSQELARRAGITDAGDLDQAIAAADIVLSIMPPAAAPEFAKAVTAVLERSPKPIYFADCNAIAPEVSRGIGVTVAAAGAHYLDVGIIGLPPKSGRCPRFYASGEYAPVLEPLAGAAFDLKLMGDEVGRASAIKMCYAALTKGTWTLQTAVLLAGQALGVDRELWAEFETSQADDLARMRARIPWLAADSQRWIGEMEQIAATFRSAGVTDGFHQGAASIFQMLANSPLSTETRANADQSRTLEQAIEIFANQIDKPAK